MRPTLLFLPGLMCDAFVWGPQLQALAAHADCVVANYGLIDSLPDMAAHALAGVRASQFALAGHSMGGRVALELLRLAPERVQRLALLDTGATALAPGEAGARERSVRTGLLALAHAQGMRAMGRAWATPMVHPDVVATPLFDAILDMVERSSPEQYAAQIKALMARPDAASLLPQIRVPTLVLTGREDLWSPPAQHVQMAQAIPGAQLHLVERCGHMATLEQPLAVSDALLHWLQRPALDAAAP